MPCSLRKLESVLKGYHISLEETGGRHPFKLIGPGGKKFPLKAHNGRKSEIGDEYLRSLCRRFNIDFKELVGRL